MTDPARSHSEDPGLVLRRRLERILYLGCAFAVYATVVGAGLERLIWGPLALGLVGFLMMSRRAGTPVHSAGRWLLGIVGAVLIPAGLLLGGGVTFMFVVTLGADGAGYLLLLAMVAIPMAAGLVFWGWLLLQSALTDPARREALHIDVEAARSSDAVRRFDAMHGPKSGQGKDRGSSSEPGTG